MSVQQRMALSVGAAIVGCVSLLIGWSADDVRWRLEYRAQAKERLAAGAELIEAPPDIVRASRAALGEEETFVTVPLDSMLLQALRPEPGDTMDLYAARRGGEKLSLVAPSVRVVYVSKVAEQPWERDYPPPSATPVVVAVPREQALDILAASRLGEIALDLPRKQNGGG